MVDINKKHLLRWSWRRWGQRMVATSHWWRHRWSRPVNMATLRGWDASLQRTTQQGHALPAKTRQKWPHESKEGHFAFKMAYKQFVVTNEQIRTRTEEQMEVAHQKKTGVMEKRGAHFQMSDQMFGSAHGWWNKRNTNSFCNTGFGCTHLLLLELVSLLFCCLCFSQRGALCRLRHAQIALVTVTLSISSLPILHLLKGL